MVLLIDVRELKIHAKAGCSLEELAIKFKASEGTISNRLKKELGFRHTFRHFLQLRRTKKPLCNAGKYGIR